MIVLHPEEQRRRLKKANMGDITMHPSRNARVKYRRCQRPHVPEIKVLNIKVTGQQPATCQLRKIRTEHEQDRYSDRMTKLFIQDERSG